MKCVHINPLLDQPVNTSLLLEFTINSLKVVRIVLTRLCRNFDRHCLRSVVDIAIELPGKIVAVT